MATLVQAVRMALHYGEEHLGVTDVFGEDVGPPLGGVFTATQGLKTAWNSPLDERGIIGTAMGIAYAGGRPVAGIQFCDYGFNTLDLLKVAGNPLDAYGLMLSAIIDPNPVMVLLPKALLRVRGEQLIPGEPADQNGLKELIDAPVGDRSRWQPRWPELTE